MAVVALIAAYEAATTVAGVVRGVQPYVASVTVVDDGSTDGTGAAARDAGASVLRLERNRGKGAALRAGFARALELGASAVVTVDADGQHDAREIPRIIDCWRSNRVAIVIGSRAAGYDRMTALRRFGNRFSRRAISFFAGAEIDDPQSGFRLYDAELLRRVPLRGLRYELESEILVKAVRSGFRLASIAVGMPRVDGTATSHFRPWRDTARICVTVVCSRLGSSACS